MKKLVAYLGVTVFLLILAGKPVDAQIVNGAYKRTDIIQKKPMPLPSVRESDVFWSRKIWRVIDLREKMNLTLYYPTTEIDGRVNLISLLLKGIENGQITPYDAGLDEEFKVQMSFDQVEARFGA